MRESGCYKSIDLIPFSRSSKALLLNKNQLNIVGVTKYLVNLVEDDTRGVIEKHFQKFMEMQGFWTKVAIKRTGNVLYIVRRTCLSIRDLKSLMSNDNSLMKSIQAVSMLKSCFKTFVTFFLNICYKGKKEENDFTFFFQKLSIRTLRNASKMYFYRQNNTLFKIKP